MRRTCHFLFATAIAAAPMPVAAQVTVDLNALNGLGAARLPAPPPSMPAAIHGAHRRTRHLARTDRRASHPETVATGKPATTVATNAPSAGPETIEHPGNLGPSFTSLPALPGAAPPPPTPPPIPAPPAAKPAAAKPQAAKPVEAATAAPAPTAPLLALPAGAPPPPPASPSRLAEATPTPPAAQAAPQPAAPQPSAQNTLPPGADRLTLPFFVQESDLPPAETAMLRDFAQREGADAHYVIRAFASAPAGDDDPSTPRRIALLRAQSVAAALTDGGIDPDRVRLLALGAAGGTPADRVEVIATPPSSGHTQTHSDSPP